MNLEFPVIIYVSLLVLYALSLMAGFSGKKIIKHIDAAGFFVCLTWIIAFAVVEKRPPLFGPFESILVIVFCLGGLSLASREAAGYCPVHILSRWTAILILMLLGILAFYPIAVNSDFYMYDNIWVNLFFHSRLLAAGVFLHAGLLAALGAWSKKKHQDPRADKMIHHSRNWLLTGIALFLFSEWTGSYWCLNWLGDSWQWSRGFFRGSIVFLLVMAACHMPRPLSGSLILRSFIVNIPGLFCLWMIFFH